MDEQFLSEYNIINNQALLQLNNYFFKNMEEISASFRKSLTDACQQIKELQQKGYHDIEYIEITLLRTRLLERNYMAPIMVYGTDWYADEKQKQAGEIDTGCIYSFYDEMVSGTMKLSKKYKAKLPERIVWELMCFTAEHYWNYVNMACRLAVKGFQTEGIGITESFRIRCSEYMGFGDIHWQYTPEMTPEQMKKWFALKEPEAYHCRDFSNSDFAGWNFTNLDLTGCDFRNCNLEGSNFERTNLTDVWFNGSCLKGASLQGTWMPGARFDHADLRGTVLVAATSACVISRRSWRRPDNIPASFVCANLQGADFTYSAIECADFTAADLKATLFLESHLDYYSFDEKQKIELFLNNARKEG